MRSKSCSRVEGALQRAQERYSSRYGDESRSISTIRETSSSGSGIKKDFGGERTGRSGSRLGSFHTPRSFQRQGSVPNLHRATSTQSLFTGSKFSRRPSEDDAYKSDSDLASLARPSRARKGSLSITYESGGSLENLQNGDTHTGSFSKQSSPFPDRFKDKENENILSTTPPSAISGRVAESNYKDIRKSIKLASERLKNIRGGLQDAASRSRRVRHSDCSTEKLIRDFVPQKPETYPMEKSYKNVDSFGGAKTVIKDPFSGAKTVIKDCRKPKDLDKNGDYYSSLGKCCEM